MSRDCACGGSNENCCRCYGRGFLADRPRLAGSGTRFENTGQFRFARKKRPSKLCPMCSARVTRLGRHLKKAHGASSSTDAHTPAAPAEHNVLPPPAPTKIVAAYPVQERLAVAGVAHSKDVCQQPVTESKSKTSQGAPTRSLIPCPECKQPVRADRLPRHRRKVHSKANTVSCGSIRVAEKKWPTPKATGFVQRDQSRVERSLDATRNIGYPCRESGRYGSHPAHDDFGDEGNA